MLMGTTRPVGGLFPSSGLPVCSKAAFSVAKKLYFVLYAKETK